MNFGNLSIEEKLKIEVRLIAKEIKHQVANKLEERNNFEKLMLALPKSLNDFCCKMLLSDDYERKYNMDQVRAIEKASDYQKQGRLNGEILFDEWGTSGQRRPSVVHLLVALDKIKLYNASNILRRYIGAEEKYNETVVFSSDNNNSNIDDSDVELKVLNEMLDPNLTSSGDHYTEAMKNLKIKNIPYAEIREKTNNFNLQRYEGLEHPGRYIGSGGFGKVFVATNLFQHYDLVAVKVMTQTNVKQNVHIYRELKIISELEHENILKLLAYSLDKGPCLVYEYANNGPLSQILKKNRQKNIEDFYEFKDRVKNMWEISNALMYLHNDKGLVHRDIKPENILLHGGIAKLCDFGLMKPLVKGFATETRIAGTNLYMAPELQFEVTAACDIYAFGLVMLSTMTDLKLVDKNREEHELFLPTYIKNRIADEDRHYEFMTPSIGMINHTQARLRLIKYAICCSSMEKTERPVINEIYAHLMEQLQS